MTNYNPQRIDPVSEQSSVRGKKKMAYIPRQIEKRWQRFWKKNRIYEVNLKKAKKPFYNLMMFPYPSAEGLHIGNMYAFTGSDIYGRFKRMQGYDVFEPIGLDGFGIHSENYALKINVHPSKQAKISEKRFYKQLEMIGNGFSWNEHLETYDPEYYKWTQWIFIQMFKNGSAYRKKQSVNWCLSCKTVLADEQVINGKCERCSSEVIKKELEQWFFKITKYADRLLKNLEKIDWSEKVKISQKNWIGQSQGAEIEFRIQNSEFRIKVFTTRIDTLFGATYLVLSPEHEIISNLKSQISNLKEVENYIEETKRRTDLQRADLTKEKTGVELKGIKAINPATKKEIPIWIADYVLSSYGTGAIMAVPAHDERDFEFAKKYSLPIVEVIKSLNNTNTDEKNISRVIILHGRQKFEQKEKPPQNVRHWLGWLNDELKKRNIEAINPLIEKDWEATYDDWKKEFSKSQVDKNTILVGTSAGGAFLVRWLGETKQTIKKLILIAPAKIPEDLENKDKKEFYNFEIDKTIRDRVKDIIIYISNDCPRIIESTDLYAKKLQAKLIKLENRGHFTVKHNPINKEIPEVLEAILECDKVFIEDGILVNSGQFSGITSEKARQKITKWLEKNNFGKKKIQYHLRDWLISRQRYWGPPIPMIYCEKCNWQSVPEKDLPVKLPFVKNFRPTGTGKSPLAADKKFYEVKCPVCGKMARRETDVSDTFLDSSWYYLAYLNQISNLKPQTSKIKNQKLKSKIENLKLKIENSPFFDSQIKKWCPVNMYIGGPEHAVLHLLYVRFVAMVLHDLKLIDFEEPFKKFRAHGLLIKEGAKMSKSKGNVLNPDDYIKKFGADALRMYLMFLAPFEQGGDFHDSGILGIVRFLERIWKFFNKCNPICSHSKHSDEFVDLNRLLHQTIKKVTEDIESLSYNTAISSLMILFNKIEKQPYQLPTTNYKLFLKLLAPFAPHIAEELWQGMIKDRGSIHNQPWPKYNEKLIKEEIISLIVQVNGRVRDKIETEPDIAEKKARELALSLEKIKKWTEGKKIKKTIFVPNKLINFVV